VIRFILLLSFTFAFQSLSSGQQEAQTNEGKWALLSENKSLVYANSSPMKNAKTHNILHLEIPRTSGNDKIIIHTGYSLLYNEKHEQASWVAYELTKEETNKRFNRSNKFITDPLVTTGSANNADYVGRGYDRGHMAPAADMSWSSTTMAESFYYSNMSPQNASFNRGIWKRLEELVRTWAIEDGAVYVITGPVLTNGLPTIGRDKVSVPKYYFKVILDYTEPGIKGIGFLLPNAGTKQPLQSFAVSIDSVESVTGIDFFPLLPDEQERLIEKTRSVNAWTWKSTSTTSTKGKASASAQCNGITKAGNRCKNKTSNINGYCNQHANQAPGSTNEPATTNPTAAPSGTNTDGQIFTGPRGGKYRINESGKKVYLKKD